MKTATYTTQSKIRFETMQKKNVAGPYLGSGVGSGVTSTIGRAVVGRLDGSPVGEGGVAWPNVSSHISRFSSGVGLCVGAGVDGGRVSGRPISYAESSSSLSMPGSSSPMPGSTNSPSAPRSSSSSPPDSPFSSSGRSPSPTWPVSASKFNSGADEGANVGPTVGTTSLSESTPSSPPTSPPPPVVQGWEQRIEIVTRVVHLLRVIPPPPDANRVVTPPPAGIEGGDRD